ncbi:hypothetical protein GCM10011514_06400 [Emticicia aquatilis]|uniref:ParB/Sulfiredoxin domain-containing protein n=1 Tax=Emticicia aquatilis TaxID=1537369 RepID=A0A917DL54_9BACT|nr:hypothetical protein [Emticicia aquatilis]GGD45077.1 hypothetical protein GCM10011514_06400 [Emticicia aquatilis]
MINELFITEKVKVSELVPSSKNPRKIKQEERKKLWERIQKYGMISIPIRDADGTLLGGKQRCELLVQYGLGDSMIDVRTATRKLTDEELREVMVIENTHAGEWDLEILKKEFDDFLDLSDYGFNLDAIDQVANEIAEAQEPEYPIVPKFSEKYSAVIIVIENSIDENFVRSVLGLEVMKDYKTSNVGESYVLNAKQFTERWNKRL